MSASSQPQPDRLYRALATLWPPHDRGALRLLLRAGARAGALPAELGKWLQAALDLPDLAVRDAMVPRVDVIAVPDTCELTEAARQMAEHGHKRVPVFRDTIDHPVGILHALDVAGALSRSDREGAARTAGELARKSPTVPETMSLLEAIHVMRSQDAHVLLATDAPGGFAGLLTLRDVLSHVLGPLPPEYAVHDRHSIHVVSQGEVIVGASAPLHTIELALGVPLPRNGFASIGGLVYAYLQRVPRPGDTVELPGLQIEVLSVEGSRVHELRIRAGPNLGHDSRLVNVGIGKEVVCGTRVIGRVELPIAEPATGRVSTFIVRTGERQVVVPLDAVERTDEGVVYLTPESCDLSRFPTYESLTPSEQAQVVASDGPVGVVRHVVVDGRTGKATHVVVRVSRGLLIPKDVVLPLSWARVVSAERIELGVPSDALLGLPEYRSDDEIRADILRRVFEDPRFEELDRYTLKVEVVAGVVRLSGRVRSAETKLTLQELAADTRGVLSVKNELLADDEIAANVEHALRSAGVPVNDIAVSVLLGQLKLRGIAGSRQVREKAARIARSVDGVQSVEIL